MPVFFGFRRAAGTFTVSVMPSPLPGGLLLGGASGAAGLVFLGGYCAGVSGGVEVVRRARRFPTTCRANQGLSRRGSGVLGGLPAKPQQCDLGLEVLGRLKGSIHRGEPQVRDFVV